MNNTTADPNRRELRRIPILRVAAAISAMVIIASACGGSSDDGSAADGSGEISLDDVTEDVLDDLDIDLDDIDLGDLDGDGQNDEEQAAESPYTGYRIWFHSGVDEIQAGGPDNLAPNPFDEFALKGPRFEVDFPSGQSDTVYVSILVASYDWAWVIAGQDNQELARLDYPTNSVDVTIDTDSLLPGGAAVALVGDDDALYVGIDDSTQNIVIVELDPTTGEERGRLSIPTSPTSIRYSMDINDTHVVLGDETTQFVVDRSTFEIAFEVTADALGGSKAGLLTEDELLIIDGSSNVNVGDTMTRHSLSDGAQIGGTEQLPGNAITRAFGDTVVQFQPNSDEKMFGVAGHGETIVGALNAAAALVPDEGGPRSIEDIYIGEGFAIVSACCIDVDFAANQSIFVIDLNTGEIVLTSKGSGTIVPPPS